MPVQGQPLTASLADEHAERLILCGAVKAADLVFPELAAAGFSAGCLYWHHHRLAFAALEDLAGGGTGEVGPHSLWLVLRARGQLPEFGPRPARWVAELWAEDPTGMNAIRAARRVVDLAARRERVLRAQETIRDAMRG